MTATGWHMTGSDDRFYMELALVEAHKGLGRTSPNPPVGAVLVKEGRVIGRGYHQKAGTAHAEVNAIADAGDMTAGATLYVTLEPCNHTGRTPPCTEAVLRAGISRVVIGVRDLNQQVEGGGAAWLQERGVLVCTGVLEEPCRELIRFFIKHNQSGLPWVAMKAAVSLDGRISYRQGQGGKISGAATLAFTHRLRDAFDAILIGGNTALTDNPRLTTRLPDGGGRDPLRVVLDSGLRLSPSCAMLQLVSPAPTWIFCNQSASSAKQIALEAQGATVIRVNAGEQGIGVSLLEVFQYLGARGICSVLVEGGGMIHGALLRKKLADQAYLFLAPCLIGNQGTPLIAGWSSEAASSSIRFTRTRITPLGDDLLVEGYF